MKIGHNYLAVWNFWFTVSSCNQKPTYPSCCLYPRVHLIPFCECLNGLKICCWISSSCDRGAWHLDCKRFLTAWGAPVRACTQWSGLFSICRVPIAFELELLWMPWPGNYAFIFRLISAVLPLTINDWPEKFGLFSCVKLLLPRVCECYVMVDGIKFL